MKTMEESYFRKKNISYSAVNIWDVTLIDHSSHQRNYFSWTRDFRIIYDIAANLVIYYLYLLNYYCTFQLIFTGNKYFNYFVNVKERGISMFGFGLFLIENLSPRERWGHVEICNHSIRISISFVYQSIKAQFWFHKFSNTPVLRDEKLRKGRNNLVLRTAQ